MTPERWQQISRIFKSAISLESAARTAFVAEQCGTDESLRSEVERLIESHQQASAENFIGNHAAEENAALLVDESEEFKPRFTKGQHFGSYEILDRLGAGGMGEVYLARDSRLERTVALKVLSPDIAEDKRRMQRFWQEAKVASSLNQPNILTIFEFGEVDGLTFLSTEFIDGKTLRDHLHGKRLPLTEILDIAIQVVTALEAAHEARIVHRDIKPENVMIRHRDHVVKVLDFGLAKVTEKGPTALGDASEADTAFRTTPGLLMGTINYMSPEQAKAQTVDERTDIWSLGVMLFEMVTGLLPFGGPTFSHTLVQIIEKEVPAFPKVADAPVELQRIIRKALAKNADERYQTAKDLLIDLKSLRRQSDHGSTPAATDYTDKDHTEKEPDKKRVLALALVAIVVVGGAFLAFALWRAAQTRSTGVVPPPVSSPTTPGPERTLTYWIMVQKYREGEYQEPYRVAGEINFEALDRIRMNVRTTQGGYLYALSEGPRDNGGTVPEYNIVFPSPTANKGSPLLAANQQIQFPEKSWLQFDKQAGVERLWLVFAEEPVLELEKVKEFASEESGGVITEMTLNKTIQNFLTTHSATKPELEKGDTLTTLKMPGKLLLYPVRLEHH